MAFLSMPTPVVVLPWGSMSTSKTRRPMSASEAPRFTAVVLLPTPPFWLTTAMMRGVPCPLVANAIALVDEALRALDQQVPLVPSRIIHDLFEQRGQRGADA